MLSGSFQPQHLGKFPAAQLLNDDQGVAKELWHPLDTIVQYAKETTSPPDRPIRRSPNPPII
ncbi:MAG: hypothetical protein HC781_13820 [Leptolyngbyaceae cyanobacterium CSU_1_4]|nr:hypothetical protein [Leptolyngbyaceae cyanobacterium CSU_1_4]